MSDRPGLSDAAFNAKLDDAALIETREEALILIAELERIISDITAPTELFHYTIAAERATDKLRDWLKRASGARQGFRLDRERVLRREQELRSVLRADEIVQKQLRNQQPKKLEASEGVAKQERLRAEAEARKAVVVAKHQAAMEYARISAETNRARRFQDVAHDLLPSETFEEIVREMKRRLAKPAMEGSTP